MIAFLAIAVLLLVYVVYLLNLEIQRLSRSIQRLWDQIRFQRRQQRGTDGRLYELTPEDPTKQLLNEIDTHGVAWLRRQAD